MSVDNGLGLDVEPGTEIEYWDEDYLEWVRGTVVDSAHIYNEDNGDLDCSFFMVRIAPDLYEELESCMLRAVGSDYEYES